MTSEPDVPRDDDLAARLRTVLDESAGTVDPGAAHRSVRGRVHAARRRQTALRTGIAVAVAALVGATAVGVSDSDGPDRRDVTVGTTAPTTATTGLEPGSDPWQGWPTLEELIAAGVVTRRELPGERITLLLGFLDGTRFQLQYDTGVERDLLDQHLSVASEISCRGCGSSYVTALLKPDPSRYEELATFPSSSGGTVRLTRDAESGLIYLVYETPRWVVRATTFDIPDQQMPRWAEGLQVVETPDGWIALQLGEGFDRARGEAGTLSLSGGGTSIEVEADACRAGESAPPVRLEHDDGSAYYAATLCFEADGFRTEIQDPEQATVAALLSGLHLEDEGVALPVETRIRDRCDEPTALDVDIGDSARDRVYVEITSWSARLGVCSARGALDEVVLMGEIDSFFAADAQGDGAADLFLGWHGVEYRVITVIDGQLRRVVLPGGRQLRVVAGFPSGPVREVFGCTGRALVQAVLTKTDSGVRVERTRYVFRSRDRVEPVVEPARIVEVTLADLPNRDVVAPCTIVAGAPPPMPEGGVPPRRRVPIGDDPCQGEPPFVPTYLPDGFSLELLPGHVPPPPGEEDARELYEPVYRYAGPAGAEIEIYHGNHWRLWYEPVGETQVLGRAALTHRVKTGGLLVDFVVGPGEHGCDYWAILGDGVSDDEVLRVAAGLTAR